MATSGNYNDLNTKPTNADFGQGIVKNKVDNPSGATDITVSFSTYSIMSGGVVSLAFTRAVPAGATLNINDMGAKPIYYHEAALPAGLIKANDRCLFMYSSGSGGRYYLIAIDRWGVDLDALATVAHTGSYNDLTNKPTIPTQLSQLNNNVGFITASDVPAQQNADWNATTGAAQILHKPNLAPVATSGDYNDLNTKPTNADFGQGIVKNKVDNPAGATDITVSFSTYSIMSGGVVSLAFTRAVPAGATLNINDMGAKPIYYHEAALPAGLIKANDRCLFMYNSGSGGRYYLIAIDRWGADLDALATVIPDITAMQQQLDSLQGEFDNLNNIPSCPSKVKDIDGNEYNTVKIGEQCWMKENLRTTHYADGTAIPEGSGTSSTNPYYYDNSSSSIPLAKRGYFYNWLALMHGAATSSANPSSVQGVCPTGWHVPSDAEWTQLKDYVGSVSEYQCGGDILDIGKALASTEGWDSSTNPCAVGNDQASNNATGFSAIPAGMKASSFYENQGRFAYFWSSTDDTTLSSTFSIASVYLTYYHQRLLPNHNSKNQGLSVRCLRDVSDGSFGDVIQDLQDQNDAMQQQLDNLAEVAFTGDYNSLENRPPIPTVNNATLTIQQNGTNVGTFTANQSTNQTVNIAAPTMEQVQALIDAAVSSLQQQVDNLQDKYDSLQDKFDSLQDVLSNATYMVPSSGSMTVSLDETVNHVDVYDWGGPDGYYGNSWDGSLTLVANSSNNVFKITGSCQTESGYDTILIYNGTGANGINTIVRLDGTGTISTPIYSSGNTITIRFGSDGSYCNYAGFALGIDVVDKPSCTAAKAVDRQGHYYNTVQIGNQCWMKENLRTTKYADGSSISNGGSNTSETTPYYYNYSSHSLPLETRGYLYNWAAVMRGAASSSANPSGVQGICPSGWHVPSDAEWTAMEATQTSMDVTADDWRGDHGGRLAGEGWNSSSVAGAPGNTNDPNHNASGFSAVPAGYSFGSSFGYAGSYAYFWSSTEYSSSNAYYRGLNYAIAGVYRNNLTKYYGRSVRCLRD